MAGAFCSVDPAAGFPEAASSGGFCVPVVFFRVRVSFILQQWDVWYFTVKALRGEHLWALIREGTGGGRIPYCELCIVVCASLGGEVLLLCSGSSCRGSGC